MNPYTERQREIARVAAHVFRENGYRGSSIREIAAEAGIRSASLYYHFKNKDEILLAIVQGFMIDFLDEVTPRLAKHADPVEALRAMIDAQVRFDAEHLDEVLVSIRERRSLPVAAQRAVNRLRAKHREAVRDVIAAGANQGSLHVRDLDISSNAVLDLVNGMVEWGLAKGDYSTEYLISLYQDYVLAVLGHNGK
jgi:AcrR family transcriptional regulator